MANEKTLAEKLGRLANRIVAGDVVFFIGAGYSLDSEGNSAGVFIARLIARLEALTEHMLGKEFKAATNNLANELRAGFEETFSLGWEVKSKSFLGDTETEKLKIAFSALQQRYFLINDWMCSAFESIVGSLADDQPNQQIMQQISDREKTLFKCYADIDPFKNKWQLAPIEYSRYFDLYNQTQKPARVRAERTAAGKALFLDTMGFHATEVMAGSPTASDLREVVASYGSRLRVRHQVLAWMAMEGILPVLITTNYDELLEGAYRLAGLLYEKPSEESRAIRVPWNRRFRYFNRIADATEFFSRGEETQQAALIVKIHGSVSTYRAARIKDIEHWRAVLPSMVFTYREIQNWREDSWSQDYLRSILRTRSVVFAGYSGEDPVIHDTFRSVYEEMAGYRPTSATNGGSGANPKQTDEKSDGSPAGAGLSERAQAFFLEGRPNFYGLEILRAASTAAGEQRPELTRHPNLLRFHFSYEPQFPWIDEMMAWTFHLVYRRLQRQALESDLARVADLLLGHPAPEREAKRIRLNFEQLIGAEHAASKRWESMDPVEARVEFERMTGWTLRFHRALLRQYAAAENMTRYPGDGFRIGEIIKFPFYCSANEHPHWAAWGVILELAIRKSYANERNDPAGWTTLSQNLEPIQWDCPAILLSTSNSAPRTCLTIELVALRNMWRESAMPLSLRLRRPLVWTLRNETIPWWKDRDGACPSDTPTAESLWNWAANRESNTPIPSLLEMAFAKGAKNV
jgi:hypothetical protein